MAFAYAVFAQFLSLEVAALLEEKSQNALVPGRQLCTQLSIIEGSLAELLRFDVVIVNFKNWGGLAE